MKKLKYGMVGGGQESLIGSAHIKAIELDRSAVLVAGCFSRSYENTLTTGGELGLSEERLYKTYIDMAKSESAREDGIDFVIVVTPNHSHFEICKTFLSAGIHVVCDKPVTVSSVQAVELQKLAKEKDLQFMVTYTYAGYVTVKNIRAMIDAGEIGEIRHVMGEYPQGWLAFKDGELSKQGAWRMDPKLSGNTNCLGDIGTHIENTVSRMTGLKIDEVLAKMDSVVPDRVLDDNSVVMTKYGGGATGLYWASQIALGHDNGLQVRIYGSKGSITWLQEDNEKIKLTKEDGTLTEIHRGHKDIKPAAAKYQRLPAGHAEGWYESMANLYVNFTKCLALQKDDKFDGSQIEYPTVTEGLEGIKFVEACIKSSNDGNVWVKV